MIKPTIGRVVLFHPAQSDSFIKTHDEQPVPALVCRVHDNGNINVGGFDAHGDHFSRQNIALIQEGEAPPEHDHYAEWMPYQIKQAAAQAQVEEGPNILSSDPVTKPATAASGNKTTKAKA